MSDFKWGILQATVYGLIQMMIGWYAPPVQTFIYFMAVILLDYVIAFGVLGLSGTISRKLGGNAVSFAVGAFTALFLRFLCHFASGILIWGSFAPEGQPVWLYSLTYNAGYMIPNAIVCGVCIVLLCTVVSPETLRPMKKRA